MTLSGFAQPMIHSSGGMKSPAPLPTLHQQRPMLQQQFSGSIPKRHRLVGTLSTGAVSIMLKNPCAPGSSGERKAPVFLPTLPTSQQQNRSFVQSFPARKSPGSSMDTVSPKMSHPSTPSPQIQHPYAGSPSPMGVTGNAKNGLAQSRPHSRSFAPSKPMTRRPSLDQYGNYPPGHANRVFPVTTPPANTPAPPAFPFQSGGNKNPDNFQSVDFSSHSHGTSWSHSGMTSAGNGSSYFWPSQQQHQPSTPTFRASPAHSVSVSAEVPSLSTSQAVHASDAGSLPQHADVASTALTADAGAGAGSVAPPSIATEVKTEASPVPVSS